MKQLNEKAYAKINLYLEVLERLPNGYHNIDTVMQTVSLCDGIELKVEDSNITQISISCDNPEVPCDSTNTVYKATMLFLEGIGASASVDICISKVIPMCAGLGGGSADAAAVLRALNKTFGEPLTREELCEVGLKVGADVPFCINGGATVCTGVGEIFSPCTALSNEYGILIAIGKQGSPTPVAYKKIDGIKNRSVHEGSKDIVNALSRGDIKGVCSEMYNAFEKVVLPANEECSRIRRVMTVGGAEGALMSGSGAAVFGIFTDERKMENTKRMLFGIADRVFVARSVSDPQ